MDVVTLTVLRDAEEEARNAMWPAVVAFANTDSDQSITGPVLVTALITYREAVERRARAEVADRMGELYVNTALLEGARAAHAEIEAGMEPTPRSELKRVQPPEGAAS